MRNYKAAQIVKFTEMLIDHEVKNYTLDFILNSEIINIEGLSFRAIIIDVEVAENRIPFNFVVIINGESEKKDINIINISEMLFVN
jgi:hypothetical protein